MSARRRWQRMALQALEGEGRRAGAARRAVIAELGSQRCCSSAHDIADRIRAGGSRVGVASVYRALEGLREEGLVQRIDAGDGGALYEPMVPGGEHHHHAICESCGRLTPFEDAELERAIHTLADRLGHRARAHDVLIRGQCPSCVRRVHQG